MAGYKQDLKVSYGDFSFPVPSPYVTRTYEHEYLGGELWATKANVSLNGQIALLPRRETAGGNNYEKLRAKRDQIAKEFAGGLGKSFQDFKVIGHGTSFILKNCSITGVSFDSSKYVGVVSYSISLSGYLEDKTTEELTAKFGPIVNSAMDKVQVAKYWTPLASAYNKTTLFSGEQKVNPDLQGYILDRSLHGLFTLIAKEEKDIRDNPAARVTDVLKKVFGANLK